MEDNIIDLALRSAGLVTSPPYGVSISVSGNFDRTNPIAYSPKLPFFKKVVVRGNIIRFANNWVSGQTGNAAGVVVFQARDLKIESNLVTLGPVLDVTLPMGIAWIENASVFNNRDMSGKLLEVVDNGTQWPTPNNETRRIPELETDLNLGLFIGL